MSQREWRRAATKITETFLATKDTKITKVRAPRKKSVAGIFLGALTFVFLVVFVATYVFVIFVATLPPSVRSGKSDIASSDGHDGPQGE
jgi:hypothetical protein